MASEPLPFESRVPTSSVRDVMPAADRWLTRAEAAAYCQCAPATISRAIKKREIACVRIRGGRSLRFRAVWLDEWLQRGYCPAA